MSSNFIRNRIEFVPRAAAVRELRTRHFTNIHEYSRKRQLNLNRNVLIHPDKIQADVRQNIEQQ